MKNMKADYHLHCQFSNDSSYPMEDVILDAIEMGLDEICFTDHVDYGVKFDVTPETEKDIPKSLRNVDYPQYFAEIARLKEKYKDKIAIKAGLEFGVQMHTLQIYHELKEKWPLDFALLSVHEIDDLEFFRYTYQEGKTQQQYNEGYYRELLKLVQNFQDYCVLAHMDLIVRYDKQGVYPFEKVKDLITEILKVVIANGKGIEINTSSIRYGLSDTTPSRAILKLYHDLGGTIITIGSDSHRPGDLGSGILQAKQILKEIGFKQFCTYENFKPIFHSL
ncbi:histidinol-phosphatase HisJ family protein [Allobaculum stercoricanis]|uniref:histidinol-phosphatase HisJ family protein n=2 Tax=Allobaculum stercoricanis TaxID=174709 RepID=UPI002943B910|nr:histidinol-phosphatase HisJ family protein [Allobaculum stercoricanis]